MNQIARPQRALFKETSQHSCVPSTYREFLRFLALGDRADLFCGSLAAAHTNHPSIKIADQKQIATVATRAREGYTHCACSGSSQSNACNRDLHLKCLCLPALLAVSSSIAKCRVCDDREHNLRRPRRLKAAASDSLLVRRVRSTFSGELRVFGPGFGIAELLIESLVLPSQLFHKCDEFG